MLDRRKFLKILGKTTLTAAPLMGLTAKATPRPRKLQGQGDLIFLGNPNSPEDLQFFRQLNAYLSRTSANWTTNLTIIDPASALSTFSGQPRQFQEQIAKLNGPILIRTTSDEGDHAEVEYWNQAWLNYALSEAEGGCYPISDGWWSVEGEWDPTWQQVRDHLNFSKNHTEARFTEEWLDSLLLEELQSVHSDHHLEMIGKGEVHWDHVNSSCPAP